MAVNEIQRTRLSPKFYLKRELKSSDFALQDTVVASKLLH